MQKVFGHVGQAKLWFWVYQVFFSQKTIHPLIGPSHERENEYKINKHSVVWGRQTLVVGGEGMEEMGWTVLLKSNVLKNVIPSYIQ